MPTTLPTRAVPPAKRKAPVIAVIFLLAFFAAMFVIEVTDPAAMDVVAAEIAAP